MGLPASLAVNTFPNGPTREEIQFPSASEEAKRQAEASKAVEAVAEELKRQQAAAATGVGGGATVPPQPHSQVQALPQHQGSLVAAGLLQPGGGEAAPGWQNLQKP